MRGGASVHGGLFEGELQKSLTPGVRRTPSASLRPLVSPARIRELGTDESAQDRWRLARAEFARLGPEGDEVFRR